MLTLGAKIKLDTSELATGENRLTKFADHFEHHFMRHFSRAFGSIALIGGAFSFVERLFGKPEEIAKISRATGFSTDEVQYLTEAARKAGITFEEYLGRAERKAIDLGKVIREMRQRGDFKIIDKKSIDQITEVEEKARKQIKDVETGGSNLIGMGIQKLRNLGYYLKNPSAQSAYLRSIKIQEQLDAGILTHPASGPISRPSESTSKSAGMTDYETRLFIRRQMRAGQEQLRLLGEQSHMERIAPELTGRQQVGAYSGARSLVVSNLSEINQKMDDLRTQAADWAQKLASIEKTVTTEGGSE